MSATARLSLPFLTPGQAQKEFTHNEALQTLDLLTAAAVEEAPRNDPPQNPAMGACYVVGGAPTGEWVTRSNCIAGFTSGGWRYVAPREGMTAYVKSMGVTANYRAGAWIFGTVRGASLVLGNLQVVGSRQGAISGPSGGSNVDVEGRSVINQVLATLRQHGLIES